MWMGRKKNIKWHEFDSQRVNVPYYPLRSYTDGKFKYEIGSGVAKIKFVEFFTSMARTAVLTNPIWYEEKFEVISFWLRFSRHFASGNEVRLRPGSVSYYKDADRTYWASRLGETFGYIEMQRRGFSIIDHMENAIKRIDPGNNVKGGSDYYCVNDKFNALAEFKGHIVKPNINDYTDIKDQLAKALDQCDKFLKKVPKLGKVSTFAVATYIREVGDSSDEPSLVAISDPVNNGELSDTNSNITPESLLESALRGNYGTWVQMMGLHDLGIDILDSSQSELNFPLYLMTITYGGNKYVFIEDEHHWDHCFYPKLNINFLYGLQEDIFRDIVLATLTNQPLTTLPSIVNIMKRKSNEIQFDLDQDSEVHIFNDGAIAISPIKFRKYHFSFELWEPSSK